RHQPVPEPRLAGPRGGRGDGGALAGRAGLALLRLVCVVAGAGGRGSVVPGDGAGELATAYRRNADALSPGAASPLDLHRADLRRAAPLDPQLRRQRGEPGGSAAMEPGALGRVRALPPALRRLRL